MYFPLKTKLQYSLNSFQTKQVLDKSYKKYSERFSYKNWSGEYNREFNIKIVQEIIDSFENESKNFELIHNNDYRYVYKSKELSKEIYLKLYKTWEASYSKFTILKRNLIRRSLAKKSFAISFKLEELKIPTIKSIFYANQGGYIPKKSIYVSLSEKNSIPISYYFETINLKTEKNGFTEKFQEDIKIVDNSLLEKRYLEFFQKLLESGVRGSYREFLGNTLIKYLDEDFTFPPL